MKQNTPYEKSQSKKHKEIVGYRALNITEPSTRVLIIQLLNP